MPAPQLASAFEGFGAAFLAAALGAAGFVDEAEAEVGAGDAVAAMGAGVEGAAAGVEAAGADPDPGAPIDAGCAGRVVASFALGVFAGMAGEVVAGDALAFAETVALPPQPLAEHDAWPAAGTEADRGDATSLACTGCGLAPPQPTRALVPSAASAAAKCSNDRLGRIVHQPPLPMEEYAPFALALRHVAKCSPPRELVSDHGTGLSDSNLVGEAEQ